MLECHSVSCLSLSLLWLTATPWGMLIPSTGKCHVLCLPGLNSCLAMPPDDHLNARHVMSSLPSLFANTSASALLQL